MTIVYRTDGPWGPGKDINLTAAEADGNTYDIVVRLGSLETTRPQPDNFASVARVGTQITFTLVSGATFSLDLPVLKWRFRGEWTPFTGYAANDTFTVAGDGLYMVLLDHISGLTFDRAAVAPGATVAAGSFAIGEAYTILTVGSTDYTLIGASANTIGVVFTATGAGAGTGAATLNIPLYFQLLALGLDLFATGVATFLGNPTSANLRAILTDATGAGPLVFGTDFPMRAVSKTSNYDIAAADSGVHFDNIGATGEVDFTLPAALPGLHYAFLIDPAQSVRIIAQAGERIALGDANSDPGGSVQAATPNYMIALECHRAGQWVVSGATGEWTLAPGVPFAQYDWPIPHGAGRARQQSVMGSWPTIQF